MTSLSFLSPEVKPGLLLHQWTRLAPGRHAPADPPVGWAERALPSGGALIEAPAGQQPAASYQDAFLGRRSTRAYAARPLELGAVIQLLRLSQPADADGATALLPLAMDVAGLAPGAYRFVPQAGALAPLKDADPRPLLREFCYQAEFVAAPLVILLASTLGGHLEQGERAYRHMLIKTGRLIQHLYLACSALGLAGSVTGSLIQPPIAEWLGLDGFAGTVLLAFAVGGFEETSHE